MRLKGRKPFGVYAPWRITSAEGLVYDKRKII